MSDTAFSVVILIEIGALSWLTGCALVSVIKRIDDTLKEEKRRAKSYNDTH